MNYWDIVKVFVILLIMLGVMYLLLYLVKKYLYSFDKKGSNTLKIKVLSTQTILPKKYVSVIEFHDQLYLIGVSDQSINLLDKLDQFIDDLNPDQDVNAEKPNFLKLLKKNMGLR